MPDSSPDPKGPVLWRVLRLLTLTGAGGVCSVCVFAAECLTVTILLQVNARCCSRLSGSIPKGPMALVAKAGLPLLHVFRVLGNTQQRSAGRPG